MILNNIWITQNTLVIFELTLFLYNLINFFSNKYFRSRNSSIENLQQQEN